MPPFLIDVPGSDPEVYAAPSPGQVTWTVKQLLEAPDPPSVILITDATSDPQVVAHALGELAMAAHNACGAPLTAVAPPF